MKSNQKLLIMFWLKKSKATKDGQAPLYARITIEGEDEEISISRKVHPNYWDTNLKRVTESSTEARETNLKISQAEIDLKNNFIVLQSQHERVTPIMLKNAYLGLPVNFSGGVIVPDIPEKKKTLLEAFSDFIAKFEKQVEKKQRSHETLKHWRTTQSKVEQFLIFQYGVIDIELESIKYTFAEKLFDYMTLEVDNPLSEVSAKGHIKKIKQILTGCVTKDYILRNPIKEYCCSGGEKDVDPLEMEQVQIINNKKLTLPRLVEVRDAYMFQIFTGFAFQDVYGLSSENIVKVGIKGERWLIKDRGKTGVSEMVPILPIVEALIDKYKDNSYCKRHNRLLPVNSNARYNGYLKELAVICGIDRDLNTHLARHTFADIMLNSGVPLEDVSKMLGHKSIRTTQRYCKVRKDRISGNMAKVKSILFTSAGKLKKVS